MKKYRKLSAFALALALCFSLAACGTTASTDTASTETTEAATEITTASTTEVASTETTAASPDNDRPGDPPSGERPDAPPDGNGPGGTPPGGGGPGGSSADIDYTGAVEITSADIFKIDSVRRTYGGNNSKALLISYLPVASSLLEKCKDLGIYCFAPEDMAARTWHVKSLPQWLDTIVQMHEL